MDMPPRGIPQTPGFRPPTPSFALAPGRREEEKKIARRGLGIGFAVIGMQVAVFVVSLILQSVMLAGGYFSKATWGDFGHMSPMLYYVQYGILYLGMLLLPFLTLALLFRMKSGECLPFQKTNKRQALLLVAAGFGVCIALNFVTQGFLNVVEGFGVVPDLTEMPKPVDPATMLVYFVLIAVLPAFVEEFAFRGVALGLLRPFGDGFAIVASAFAFGVMHGNLVQIPFAFAGGLVFGFIAVKTGSLWPGMLLHFCNNALSVGQELLGMYVGDQTLAYISYGAYFLILLCGLLAAACLFRRHAGLFSTAPQESPLLTDQRKFSKFVLNAGMLLCLGYVAYSTISQLRFVA